MSAEEQDNQQYNVLNYINFQSVTEYCSGSFGIDLENCFALHCTDYASAHRILQQGSMMPGSRVRSCSSNRKHIHFSLRLPHNSDTHLIGCHAHKRIWIYINVHWNVRVLESLERQYLISQNACLLCRQDIPVSEVHILDMSHHCLLYTSPSPRD